MYASVASQADRDGDGNDGDDEEGRRDEEKDGEDVEEEEEKREKSTDGDDEDEEDYSQVCKTRTNKHPMLFFQNRLFLN